MEALIDREITSFFQHGGVGLKSTSALGVPAWNCCLRRSGIEIEWTEIVVARKAPSESKRKKLEDYLMTKVLQKLNQLKKPIQVSHWKPAKIGTWSRTPIRWN